MDEKQLAVFERVAEQGFSAGQASYAELSKWILASLLALNGGSVLLFVQVYGSLPKLGSSLSPLLFLMGALFAIASGVSARKRNLNASETFLKLLMATTNDQRVAILRQGGDLDLRFDRLADGSIVMSLVALVAGSLFLWKRIEALTVIAAP